LSIYDAIDQGYIGTMLTCPSCQTQQIFAAPQAQGYMPVQQPQGPMPVQQPQQPQAMMPMQAAQIYQPQPQQMTPQQQWNQHYQMAAQVQPQPFVQQERASHHITSRKINMGGGCLAMLAVFAAFTLIGGGLTFVFNFISQALCGIWMILGALASIAAFAFFGYFASESSVSLSGVDRR
jgi:hypothetical protein